MNCAIPGCVYDSYKQTGVHVCLFTKCQRRQEGEKRLRAEIKRLENLRNPSFEMAARLIKLKLELNGGD